MGIVRKGNLGIKVAPHHVLNTGHYVQMGVVIFIEDDAQLVCVRLFLFHWFKTTDLLQDNQSKIKS